MSRLTQYIELTLREESRFALPGLGTFRIDRLPARPDRAKGLIYPPRRQIRFLAGNASDDGILLRRYLSGEGSPEEQKRKAKEALASEIAALRQLLESGTAVPIGHLGLLTADPWHKGEIHFRSDADNRGFNLPAVTLTTDHRDDPVISSAEETGVEGLYIEETAEEETPPEEVCDEGVPTAEEPLSAYTVREPEQGEAQGKKRRSRQPLLIGVILILILVGAILLILLLPHNQPAKVEEKPQTPIVERPAAPEPVAEEAAPVPTRETLAGLPIYQQGEITPRRYIIIASLLSDKEVESFVETNNVKEVFPDAGLLLMRNGQRRVFADAAEGADTALERLREVRRHDRFAQSWIYLDN